MPKDNSKYSIVFAPAANRQLAAIYTYIARAASPDIAARYVDGIIEHCGKLDLFPLRGVSRDDLFPGLRMCSYKKRVQISYLVDTERMRVSIVGVFYGGQDYERIIKNSILYKA